MTTPRVTTYHYDSSNRLTEIDEPNGTTVTFAYDANGQRIKKTTQTGGANPTMTVVNDTYQNGRLAYQTNLGGTVLAKMEAGRGGSRELILDGQEERILALLAVVYGEAVNFRVLEAVRRASNYWSNGEPVLAVIALARSGLPPLDGPERTSIGLSAAERLLDHSLSPRELIKACGLDPTLLDLRKTGYNPDQPRVPAGNPDGGQWTSEGPKTTSAQPNLVLANYRIIKEPPSDAKLVVPPDGVPISAGDPRTVLLAPPRADFRAVYAAGRAIAALPYADQIRQGYAALHHGGTFDFQRNAATQEDYKAYEHASNYAVGVYMAGAGYSLRQTLHIAEAYAFFNSSNYGSKEQKDWTTAGWQDATAGRWK